MRWLLSIFLFCGSLKVRADEVIRVSWQTAHPAAPVQLDRPAADFLPMFRLALTNLPESAIVTLALSQPALLGLNSTQAATLRPLATARYELIAKSPVYSGVASALPYCLAEKRPQEGLALGAYSQGCGCAHAGACVSAWLRRQFSLVSASAG